MISRKLPTIPLDRQIIIPSPDGQIKIYELPVCIVSVQYDAATKSNIITYWGEGDVADFEGLVLDENRQPIDILVGNYERIKDENDNKDYSGSVDYSHVTYQPPHLFLRRQEWLPLLDMPNFK